jgi:PAS domain S-box-containing protein
MPAKKKTSPQNPAEGRPDAPAGSPIPPQDFFYSSPLPTVIIDEDTTISEVNRRFEELSGFGRKQIVKKKSWMQFVSPDDREKHIAYHREMIKPEGWAPQTYSFGFVDRSKKTTPSFIHVQKIPGTTRVIASITDGTVQKKLEVQVRANEERYRVLVNNLSLGVYKNRLETPGKILWANPALISMYGYHSLPEFMKQPVSSTYADPRDRERFIHMLLNTGYVKDFEVRQKRKDGTVFWARISALPKKNKEGTIEWIEGTVEDINTSRVTIDACEQMNQFLSEVLDSVISVGIICTDTNGTITLFNQGAERMLGYSATEVLGKTTLLRFHDEGEVMVRSSELAQERSLPVVGFDAITRQALETGVEEREWTYVKKDAARIVVNQTVVPVTNRSGTLRGFLFTVKEITDKKRLEETFRSSNLQMSGVIYNLPDATFAIDREGRVIAWNRAMEELTGVRAVDILGRGNREYSLPLYGDRRPLLINLINLPDYQIEEYGYSTINRKGNSVAAETPMIDMNNRPRVLRCIAAPIFDHTGERAGAIETITDITEEKKEVVALQDSVLQFREIFENTGSATAIIEEDDTISYLNPEFERMLGYVRDEIEGKKKWTEFVAPGDPVIAGIREYRERQCLDHAGNPSRYEFRFIRFDGQVRNGYLTITCIPDTGKIVMALFDITDKVVAEEAVQRANTKINFFNSVTRHDILNQLTVLKGHLELSQETVPDPGLGRTIAKELAAAEAIQSLILFTRDYQDIGIEPPEWQDLRGTIRKACAGIRLKDMDIVVDIENVEIFADRLLGTVFINLIQNTLRHGEKTKSIRFSCEESFEELHVICEDDGIGVPPEAKEKIFNRQFFTQSGLDMYLVREILSITGISIKENGTFGKGARFEIHAPKERYRFTISS